MHWPARGRRSVGPRPQQLLPGRLASGHLDRPHPGCARDGVRPRRRHRPRRVVLRQAGPVRCRGNADRSGRDRAGSRSASGTSGCALAPGPGSETEQDAPEEEPRFPQQQSPPQRRGLHRLGRGDEAERTSATEVSCRRPCTVARTAPPRQPAETTAWAAGAPRLDKGEGQQPAEDLQDAGDPHHRDDRRITGQNQLLNAPSQGAEPDQATGDPTEADGGEDEGRRSGRAGRPRPSRSAGVC